MDTSYTYPQLFDMDTTFDTDLFGGLNLSDNYLDNSTNKKGGDYVVNNHHSYLQYLQNNNNEFYYDATSQQMLFMPPTQTAPSMDLADYDFNPPTDQKLQQYNWLYDPIDSFLPPQQQQNHLFHEELPSSVSSSSHMNQFDSIMSENIDTMSTVQGGMSRDYVSLSDVNSFVAKADSKHSCLQVPTDFTGRTDFSSSESTTNEDSEDDYSDSENELRWPSFHTNHDKQKLLIKIKKPLSSSSAVVPNTNTSTYGTEWLIPPTKKNVYRNKYRKSMSNIFLDKKSNSNINNHTNNNNKRRGSAPHHLSQHAHPHHRLSQSLHSSSSLTSLSNTLQRSMRVSDSMNFLSHHSSDEEVEEEEEEEEEEDDDEYQIRQNAHPHHHHHQVPAKKGRNVDKACNHCKRSHLRCDDMRPCRRCVATGKTGCKDVQHKPRGRPKLHKK